MNIVLYGIPNCDTVKKARAWLDGQGVAYRFHDFKKQGVPGEQLDGWISQLGWERAASTGKERPGASWTPAAQADVKDAASAKALMQLAAQRDQAPGRGMGRENHGRLRSGRPGRCLRMAERALLPPLYPALPKWRLLAGRIFLKLKHW